VCFKREVMSDQAQRKRRAGVKLGISGAVHGNDLACSAKLRDRRCEAWTQKLWGTLDEKSLERRGLSERQLCASK
jgi:hypothetical protein